MAISARPAPAVERRGVLMATLFAAQVCGSTGHSMSMAVGGILAADITGTNAWTGLPVAIGALGAALASWPLSRLMGRVGRRPGLTLGYGLAVVGALLGIAGVLTRSFALLLVGMALFGVASTSNLLARYAAADVTASAHRGRAMGLIVWGSTLGSILGPTLMPGAVRAGALLGLSPVASAFLISVTGFALAALLVEALLRPDPLAIARALDTRAALDRLAAPARRLGEILGDVRVRIAVGTLMASQVVMIGTTSTSPVHLRDHGGSVSTIGLAVGMHLGGMYIASPLSGWLCDRFGRLPVIAGGGVLLLAAVFVAGVPPGSESGLVIVGLFLNGVGWNLAFVAGSALLTDALSPDERTSVQGLADLVMGLMGALGSAVGGMVLGAWGFAALNALGGGVVCGGLAALWLYRPGRVSVAIPLGGQPER
ncbi:MAG: MFS transporter [Candidatus Rokuibacteriota bacterium]|nr:MAG: MFS transporter [Candidatus Rokubacteria bacterium]